MSEHIIMSRRTATHIANSLYNLLSECPRERWGSYTGAENLRDAIDRAISGDDALVADLDRHVKLVETQNKG